MPISLISVIVPVFNGETFLAEALQSVLHQACPPLEIIVVDDGSTDGTAGIAALFPQARYIYQSNRGPAGARNAGLALAQGEIVAFLDADDVWSDDKLTVQCALLSAHAETQIVLGRLQMVSACPRVDGRLCPETVSPAWQGFYLGAALIRHSAFQNIGTFDETLAQCEDLDWFLRAHEAGLGTVTHGDIMLYYRRHRQNLSLYNPLANKFMVLALKKSLDRRRQKRV